MASLLHPDLRRRTQEVLRLHWHSTVSITHTRVLLLLTANRYWDWERSSNMYDDIRNDPIWSPTIGVGVGGDGFNTTDELLQCVQDGPFKNLRPAWYRGRWAPKCLTRQFDPPSAISTNGRWMLANWYTTAFMDYPRYATPYSSFRTALEGRGHAQVHGGIGGDLEPTNTSPNEPLFLLHHTNVDRYWWTW